MSEASSKPKRIVVQSKSTSPEKKKEVLYWLHGEALTLHCRSVVSGHEQHPLRRLQPLCLLPISPTLQISRLIPHHPRLLLRLLVLVSGKNEKSFRSLC